MQDAPWDPNQEPLINWTVNPVFEFASEAEALQTLELLGDELRVAREQVRHAMRYVGRAVQAAGRIENDGQPVQPQAIIRHSGLARQTVYDLLGKS